MQRNMQAKARQFGGLKRWLKDDPNAAHQMMILQLSMVFDNERLLLQEDDIKQWCCLLLMGVLDQTMDKAVGVALCNPLEDASDEGDSNDEEDHCNCALHPESDGPAAPGSSRNRANARVRARARAITQISVCCFVTMMRRNNISMPRAQELLGDRAGAWVVENSMTGGLWSIKDIFIL